VRSPARSGCTVLLGVTYLVESIGAHELTGTLLSMSDSAGMHAA
jgi:hypothetical protein